MHCFQCVQSQVFSLGAGYISCPGCDACDIPNCLALNALWYDVVWGKQAYQGMEGVYFELWHMDHVSVAGNKLQMRPCSVSLRMNCAIKLPMSSLNAEIQQNGGSGALDRCFLHGTSKIWIACTRYGAHCKRIGCKNYLSLINYLLDIF